MTKGGRTPNDDRSDSKNPNNPAYHAAVANRGDQLNPDHDAFWQSRDQEHHQGESSEEGK